MKIALFEKRLAQGFLLYGTVIMNSWGGGGGGGKCAPLSRTLTLLK